MQPSLMELVRQIPHANDCPANNTITVNPAQPVTFYPLCLPDCTACALLAKVQEIIAEQKEWRDRGAASGDRAFHYAASECADSLLALVGEGK